MGEGSAHRGPKRAVVLGIVGDDYDYSGDGYSGSAPDARSLHRRKELGTVCSLAVGMFLRKLLELFHFQRI